MSIKNEECSVAVLLATFNGGLYLKEQINSIISQDYSNWRLYIRDDGSTDNTLKVIDEFVAKDARIVLINDEYGNLGAAHNFEQLIKYTLNSEEMYFCFSDQDDVWLSNKLRKSTALVNNSRVKDAELPLLIYSDMEVVDANLKRISLSFMDYQGLYHAASNPVHVLLTQNFVTGCTMLLNRRLLDFAFPVPKEALMHDWWLALCAVVFGQIDYIDESLLKYRQHGNNEVGAKHFGDYLNPFSGKWKKRWLEGRMNLFQSMKQAQALADRIREHDPENPHLALVEAYASLHGLSPLKRISKFHKLRVHAQSNSRQALLLSRLLLTPKDKYV